VTASRTFGVFTATAEDMEAWLTTLSGMLGVPVTRQAADAPVEGDTGAAPLDGGDGASTPAPVPTEAPVSAAAPETALATDVQAVSLSEVRRPPSPR
jgi:hypothetical protein